MSSNPLITVIVPVYKVEPYLAKCVDSILEQSYKNIEVVLVDDGSPDGCGKICDNYAVKDSRVRVIHRENGGISATRNSGIDVAAGEYILFVDSDDFVDADIVEYLLDKIQLSGADMVFSSFELFYDDKGDKLYGHNPTSKSEVFTVSPIEALNETLYGRSATFHAWAKLYRKELFNNIRFPEGKLFEDAGTIYKLILKSNKILISTVEKYHYLCRKGSILHSGFSPNMMDSVYFAKDILKITQSKQYSEGKKAAEAYLFMSAISIFDILVSSNDIKKYPNQYTELWHIIQHERRSVLNNNFASKRSRIYALISTFGKKMTRNVIRSKSFLKSKKSNRS